MMRQGNLSHLHSNGRGRERKCKLKGFHGETESLVWVRAKRCGGICKRWVDSREISAKVYLNGTKFKWRV